MEYRVVRPFADKTDGYYAYSVGDLFPHAGLKVSAARLEELSSDKNMQGHPLIEAVAKQPVTAAEVAEEKVVPKRGRRKKREN